MRQLLALLVIAIVTAACSKAGDGDKLTSIDQAKKMGDLSKEEKKQLCEDFKVFQKKAKPTEDEMLKMTCSAQGVFSVIRSEAKDDAALRGECKKAVDECIAKKQVPPEKELDCTSEEFLGKMSECKEVTIAEISECIKDMSGVMKKFAAEDICGALKVSDKSGVDAMFDKMKSPKCEAIESKCKGKGNVGSGSGPQPSTRTADPELEKEAMAKVEEFTAKMCACKDKACAEGISKAMTDWGAEMAKKTGDSQPSPGMVKKMTDAVTKYTECMTKLLVEESPAPAPAPAPAGSATPPAKP